MSYKRYKSICRQFCFEDYDSITDEQKAIDKAWKIRGIFTMLQEAFKETLPAPNEHISFDEGMGRFLVEHQV